MIHNSSQQLIGKNLRKVIFFLAALLVLGTQVEHGVK